MKIFNTAHRAILLNVISVLFSSTLILSNDSVKIFKESNSLLDVVTDINNKSTNINKTDPLIPINITNVTVIPYQDILQVDFFNSSLTKEQKDDYINWVKFKNSFEPKKLLAKMAKYFDPESSTYYSDVFNFGWPFYLLAAVFALLFLVYLVMRFLFRRFLGPKHHMTTWLALWAYLLICKHIIIGVLN